MKLWVSKHCAAGKAESEALVSDFKAHFDQAVRRYGWFDSGSVYIGGSVARGELLKTSDLDLIYFLPEGGIRGDGKPSSSALSVFRAASTFNVKHSRKVNVISLDYERVPNRCLPPMLGAGFLKGNRRDIEALFMPGANSERATLKLRDAISSLSAVAKHDPNCVKAGFNGLRFSTVALCLCYVRGEQELRQDLERCRAVLYAYCRAAELAGGHCGLEDGEQMVLKMSDADRADCGPHLIEAVESARERVRRIVLDLCRM